ncbi:hypothetical protein HPB48_025140 [Haemaphysalis longicornis]|uniref:Secreted protein n=1 Tax=Haemaphysalis longicornis TaxID=44386 RepID=A0A9J6H8G1_HAELO|nr:hypothetical protein HPB48_025140 [Haemaphysalis longicornis]
MLVAVVLGVGCAETAAVVPWLQGPMGAALEAGFVLEESAAAVYWVSATAAAVAACCCFSPSVPPPRHSVPVGQAQSWVSARLAPADDSAGLEEADAAA